MMGSRFHGTLKARPPWVSLLHSLTTQSWRGQSSRILRGFYRGNTGS